MKKSQKGNFSHDEENKKGFTLTEMLIVVAIIAMLTVIAIPTINNAMPRARAAADVANIRSGYAAAQVETMTSSLKDTTTCYLKSDGSVTTTSDGDNYTCRGDSSKATAGTKIGGKFAVNDRAEWTKDGTITYTVEAENDGVPTVTGIGTNSNGGGNVTAPDGGEG